MSSVSTLDLAVADLNLDQDVQIVELQDLQVLYEKRAKCHGIRAHEIRVSLSSIKITEEKRSNLCGFENSAVPSSLSKEGSLHMGETLTDHPRDQPDL